MSLLGALIGPVAGLLERVIPDKGERDRMAHEIASTAQKHAAAEVQAQLAINLAEARHPSRFVAGWRPFLGWVGGSVLLANYAIYPLLASFGLAIEPVDGTGMGILTGILMTLITGRSVEKWRGVQSTQMGKQK